ncbi:hypothetical protein [Planctomicrobium sp. SH664]|uniref:hypothetical protein n=1 Tax=Planctomicrobium sp. SH664 TaxID=3448125 RepID=UPI003F5C0C3A
MLQSFSPILKLALVIFSMVATVLPFPILRAAGGTMVETNERVETAEERVSVGHRCEVPPPGEQKVPGAVPCAKSRLHRSSSFEKIGSVATGHVLANGLNAPLTT